MQTLGNALQLAGSIITLGGLIYIWHKASGRLLQWHAGLRDRLNQLRKSTDIIITPGPARVTITAHAPTIHTTSGPRTTEDRLRWFEGENSRRTDELKTLAENLRAEIDAAQAAVLDESKKLSDAVRLKDVYPAMFGLVVSSAGIICQLAS